MTLRYPLALAFSAALPLAAAAATASEGDEPSENQAPRVTRPADDVLPLLTPGLRVRLESENVRGRITGRILETTERGLRLMTDNGVPVRVPFEAITGLEASFTRRRHTREGLVVGLALGALAGALAEVDEYACDFEDSTAFCSRGEAIAGGIGGGALLGAGIGALVRTDRWQTVSLERVRVSLTPDVAGGRSAGVRLALSW